MALLLSSVKRAIAYRTFLSILFDNDRQLFKDSKQIVVSIGVSYVDQGRKFFWWGCQPPDGL
jgi:hypothetical protein